MASPAAVPGPVGEPGKPAGPRLWLTGPLRHAATVALALVFVVNVALALRMLYGGVEIPDTTARVRAEGPAVAVYDAAEGGNRIHLLPAGAVIDLSDPSRMPGPRLHAHIRVDDMVVEGFVDSKDVLPEDIDRVRRVYQSGR